MPQGTKYYKLCYWQICFFQIHSCMKTTLWKRRLGKDVFIQKVRMVSGSSHSLQWGGFAKVTPGEQVSYSQPLPFNSSLPWGPSESQAQSTFLNCYHVMEHLDPTFLNAKTKWRSCWLKWGPYPTKVMPVENGTHQTPLSSELIDLWWVNIGSWRENTWSNLLFPRMCFPFQVIVVIQYKKRNSLLISGVLRP